MAAAYEPQWNQVTPVKDCVEVLLETALTSAGFRARVRDIGTYVEVRAIGDNRDQMRALTLVERTLAAAGIHRDVYGVER